MFVKPAGGSKVLSSICFQLTNRKNWCFFISSKSVPSLKWGSRCSSFWIMSFAKLSTFLPKVISPLSAARHTCVTLAPLKGVFLLSSYPQ